jgi:hypothetical protein
MEERRNHQSIILLYKIINSHVAVPVEYHPEAATNRSTRDTNTHSLKRYQPRINAYKYSFLTRTVPLWNAMPPEVVSTPTLDTLKARLQKI